MTIRRWVVLLAATALSAGALIGCGGSTTTVIQQVTATTEETSTDSSAGPRLGDECVAETTITSLGEVDTKTGPMTCEEAQGILRVYFESAPTEASGSGGGLSVGKWFCILTPVGANSSKVGQCEERGKGGRAFAMYSAGWAERPENRNEPCDVAPPDGGGVVEVRATNIDCQAAIAISQQFADPESCSPVGGDGYQCRLPEGYVCTSKPAGYDGAITTCASGDQKAVIKTAA